MLTEKEVAKIRDELDHCNKPLFLFDDDPDGVSSFLLMYRYKKEGKGVLVKTNPKIDDKFIKYVEEFSPDKIFILDIADVEQDFLDKVHLPVIWIDHHELAERSKVHYFNPRKHGSNEPTSYLCYQVVQQDLWIAMAGIVGDWYYPKELAEQFRKEFPGLLPEHIATPDDALFETELGNLIRILAFALKGSTKNANTCVKILTRIQHPDELLKSTTPAGQYIRRQIKDMYEEYDMLLKEALKQKVDKILAYTYPSTNTSYTGELANELLHRFPSKVVLIGRKKSGEVRCSLRSPKAINIRDIMQAAIQGLPGAYGGGHEQACGVCVKEEDFPEFVRRLEENI